MIKKPIFEVKRSMLDPSTLSFLITLLIGIIMGLFDSKLVKIFSHICIVFSIFGAIIQLIVLKAYVILVYDNYIIIDQWIISRNEEKILTKNITSVKIKTTLIGRIFNYGDIEFNIYGRNKIFIPHIKNANYLKEYLENNMNI